MMKLRKREKTIRNKVKVDIKMQSLCLKEKRKEEKLLF